MCVPLHRDSRSHRENRRRLSNSTKIDCIRLAPSLHPETLKYKKMLGNFTFHNPTKLHFGEDSLSKLSEELKNYGKKIMLCYGGGSIKRNGIYDQVMAELKKAGCLR